MVIVAIGCLFSSPRADAAGMSAVNAVAKSSTRSLPTFCAIEERSLKRKNANSG
jgi:hypothetical protein